MVMATEAIEQKSKLIFKDLFNPKCAQYVADPYSYYAEVRTKCPVYKTPYGVYMLTRYTDIQTALTNKQLIKDYWTPLLKIYGEQCYQESGFTLISNWLINKNPPVHTQVRKLLTTALAAKNMGFIRQSAEAMANKLIDDFFQNGQADLILAYAYKLPVLVIFQLLGIPEVDYEFLFEHVSLPSVLLDPRCLKREVLDAANQLVDKLTDYFADLCKAREKNLGTDLISLLLAARKNEQISLSDAELISNIFFLFGAGHETTMNLISSGIYTLHKYPEALKELRSCWEMLPQAVEEILRYEAPVQVGSPNIALGPIMIGEYCIPEGSIIMPILGAACRDPEEYIEPDKFDISRKSQQILSFGFGIHLCLGAQLARMEGSVALRTLLERIPTLEIKEINTPKWRPVMSVRGLTTLEAFWKL